MFSSSETVNPDFYNWNAVALMYCDGGSFTGDREEPDVFAGKDLYYRGNRNLKAIILHLNEKVGLLDATDVILAGCSAGGLGVFLHADFIQTQIVGTAKYRAYPDADIPAVTGSMDFVEQFKSLLKVHNAEGALIPECREDYEGSELWKCLFAPYVYRYIKTPIYVVNSHYDSVILLYNYLQPCIPPDCNKEGEATFKH